METTEKILRSLQQRFLDVQSDVEEAKNSATEADKRAASAEEQAANTRRLLAQKEAATAEYVAGMHREDHTEEPAVAEVESMLIVEPNSELLKSSWIVFLNHQVDDFGHLPMANWSREASLSVDEEAQSQRLFLASPSGDHSDSSNSYFTDAESTASKGKRREILPRPLADGDSSMSDIDARPGGRLASRKGFFLSDDNQSTPVPRKRFPPSQNRSYLNEGSSRDMGQAVAPAPMRSYSPSVGEMDSGRSARRVPAITPMKNLRRDEVHSIFLDYLQQLIANVGSKATAVQKEATSTCSSCSGSSSILTSGEVQCLLFISFIKPNLTSSSAWIPLNECED